ncbi:MAG: hypothetical protein V9E81_08605 [Marmoricola sp.]
MATSESDFDTFYSSKWRPLLLQTLAICGDLDVAQTALKRSFAELWQHWPGPTDEHPVDVVRARAWQLAQWQTHRPSTRRNKLITPEQQGVLTALQAVTLQPRKALVLAGLSDLPLQTIARIIDEPEDGLDQLFETGLTQLSEALKTTPEDAASKLEQLAPILDQAAPPAAKDVRRTAKVRTGRRLGIGVAAAIALTAGAGYLVKAAPGSVLPDAPALGPAVTSAMLLTPTALQPLGDPALWKEASTTDNTEGDGLNSRCQKERFADPEGRKALVRTLDYSGKPSREAVQTIEVSQSVLLAKQAYSNVVSWFAGCQEARLQLLSSYQIKKLGDEALVLQFRSEPQQADAPANNFAVGIARVGQITTWTTVQSQGNRGAGITALADTLNSSLYKICGSRITGRCELSPEIEELPPPPSGEALGMLAVADLPAVGKITNPWAGTDAAPSEINPAATSCDDADFSASKSQLTRTFLIPEAGLPDQFGLSETIGTFESEQDAKNFVAEVVKAMSTCEDRQLSASISDAAGQDSSRFRSQWHTWRLDSEIKDRTTVRFLMGIVQVGPYVAQLNFVPDGDATMEKAVFEALTQRARDRLLELKRPTQSASSGSATPSPSSTPN